MNITTSYKVQIVGINKMLRLTVNKYREALSFLIPIVNKEWDIISTASGVKRKTIVEHLIHTTKDNEAKYSEFDQLFFKMPSYFRRGVIADAIGIVSSYRSNYENWKKNGEIGKLPRLQTKHYNCPVFYRDNTYEETDNPNIVNLKLYINNDWVWYPVHLRATDIKYIQKYCQNKEMSAPILEKRYNKYYLRFAFTEKVKLNEIKAENQKVLAVDLGVNNDAVCSVMTADGTVLNRKFINFKSDKDRLYHTLNKIKKKQKKHQSVSKLWSYAKNCNEQHSIKIAQAIVDYAVQNAVHCIVFEHLDTNGKVKGSKKQKLTMWRKNYIQGIVTNKAHRMGIRISHICAWNTSKLSFDGSGEVKREKDNYSMCTLGNGKQYHSDLNASYNIGARYFIREILKPLSATVRSQLEAQVPSIAKRTQCTLSTLINLNAGLRTSVLAS